MKTTRREFLDHRGRGAGGRRRSCSACRTRPARRRRCSGSGAYTYEAIHDWGELPPRIKWGNTHGVVEDSQGHIYVHHTVHATSDSADTMVVFDREGQVRPLVGQRLPRRRARPAHAQGRQGRVPLSDGERRQPEDDAAAGDAGGGREDDDEGRSRLEDRRSAGHRRVQARSPTARRSDTTRPMSRSRRTAISMLATATARTTLISTTAKRSTSARSAAKVQRPGN